MFKGIKAEKNKNIEKTLYKNYIFWKNNRNRDYIYTKVAELQLEL